MKSFMLLACNDDLHFFFTISITLKPLSHEALDVGKCCNDTEELA
jgi:hypothetical protein